MTDETTPTTPAPTYAPDVHPQEAAMSERRARLMHLVQSWLDKFAEEKLNVNYAASLSAVIVQAEHIYLRLLVDTGVIEEEEATCKQLEIQAIILEEQFKKALLARDEMILRQGQDAAREASQAGRIQPVHHPKIITLGSSSGRAGGRGR